MIKICREPTLHEEKNQTPQETEDGGPDCQNSAPEKCHWSNGETNLHVEEKEYKPIEKTLWLVKTRVTGTRLQATGWEAAR